MEIPEQSRSFENEPNLNFILEKEVKLEGETVEALKLSEHFCNEDQVENSCAQEDTLIEEIEVSHELASFNIIGDKMQDLKLPALYRPIIVVYYCVLLV